MTIKDLFMKVEDFNKTAVQFNFNKQTLIYIELGGTHYEGNDYEGFENYCKEEFIPTFVESLLTADFEGFYDGEATTVINYELGPEIKVCPIRVVVYHN